MTVSLVSRYQLSEFLLLCFTQITLAFYDICGDKLENANIDRSFWNENAVFICIWISADKVWRFSHRPELSERPNSQPFLGSLRRRVMASPRENGRRVEFAEGGWGTCARITLPPANPEMELEWLGRGEGPKMKGRKFAILNTKKLCIVFTEVSK